MKQLRSILVALSRAIIASAFWIATRVAYHVEISGLNYDTKTPRTYLAMSHKRDLDPILLVPTIVFHRGWRALAGSVHFALRGDAFAPGYLARMVMHPRWLSFLLRFLSIGPVLRWLGVNPTDSLLRPVEEWIREVIRVEGDGRVGDVLAPFLIEDLATAAGEAYERVASSRLSQLLTWHYHHALQYYYGPEILIEPVRRAAQRRTVASIKEYLASLDAWLWSGGTLYGSPEGQLSPDGTLSPINSGLHRILRTAPPETRIVPIFQVYDFMTTKRQRIFIDFAPAIERAPQLPPTELDAQLRRAWLCSARFTCTQLASGFLMQASRDGLSSFTVDDMAKSIHMQATSLQKAGRHVDLQLLQQPGARKRAEGFLAYAVRHQLVRRNTQGAWTPTITETPIKVRPREVGYDQFPLVYAWNELQEMLSVSS